MIELLVNRFKNERILLFRYVYLDPVFLSDANSIKIRIFLVLC
jgi:hypothetical protein